MAPNNAYTFLIDMIPPRWVVQTIRHRWWGEGMAADQVWVCELFKLDSDDGRIITGKGANPGSAVKDAINRIASSNALSHHLKATPA